MAGGASSSAPEQRFGGVVGDQSLLTASDRGVDQTTRESGWVQGLGTVGSHQGAARSSRLCIPSNQDDFGKLRSEVLMERT